jgi:Icc-related predicted phosphoesterase
MPSQRVLFTSDLHGRDELYSELVLCAREVRPQVVLLGGDLFAGDPREQMQFVRGPFDVTLSRLQQVGVERVGVLPGNDDWNAAHELLRHSDHSDALHMISDAPWELEQGVNIVGYAYTPLTPFSVKDFEKLDHYRPDKRDVLEAQATGVASEGSEVADVSRSLDGSDSIERDLLALDPHIRPGRSIFVSHCPPRSTRLDMAYGRHAGSQAVREFLERTRPALSLHGHVPSIDLRGGVFAERVGATLAVNPGQGASLHAVYFEAENAVETLEHTILGRWTAAQTPAAAGVGGETSESSLPRTSRGSDRGA